MLICVVELTARGRGGGHKGGRKIYTNPEELAARQAKEQKDREWRRKKGDDVTDDEDEDESGEDEETSSEEEVKPKGVQSLIEIENPNRISRKPTTKPGAADAEGAAGPSTVKVELSRREREELEKQKARENYNRLHAEGKTEQARQDLARLALIRRQREEAAAKKAAEKEQKDTEVKTNQQQKVAAVKSTVSQVTDKTALPSKSKRGGKN